MTTLAVPTKRCAGPCGQTLPWTEFHAKTRWDDGTMRQPHSYCKACQREYVAKWHRERRASDPEWKAARDRQRYDSLRNDPERWDADLERRRQWKREKHGYTVERRRKRSTCGRSPTVDAAPFAAWLSEKVAEYGGVLRLAAACGMNDTRVRKIKNGGIPRVELSQVDAALQAEGSTHIDAIYPLEGLTT